MGLSAPIVYYGVHTFTPYKADTGEFYKELRVVDSSSLAISGKLVELMGGSGKGPWAIEDSELNTEISLKASEYPSWLYELFLGKAPTVGSAETTGNVSTLTNKKGTSCKSATTGIASAGAKSASESDLKFGKYVVVVKTSSTVDVLCSTDVDFGRGTAKSFKDDTMSVLASNLTITAGAGTDIPGFGLTLTGGSGAIGMTVGDTATFEVRPINTKNMVVTIGDLTDTYPEFGCIIMGQKRGNGELVEIDVFRCKNQGLPHNFDTKKFSTWDAKIKAMYDSTRSGICEIRTVG